MIRTPAELADALEAEERRLHALGDCPHGSRALLREAAAALRAPREFTPEQVEAVADALLRTHYPNVFAELPTVSEYVEPWGTLNLAQAALSAIGEVRDV